MKNKVFMVLCLMLLTACSTDSLNDFLDKNNVIGSGSVSIGSGSNDSSGNLLDFDVSWDDISEADFTDVTEAIPTDNNDEEYEDFVENSSFHSQINIAYNGNSATVSGSVGGVTVTVDGANVTVNSTTKSVEYILSGSTTDGSFKIYSENKFKLTLNGVSITSAQGAAINIQSSKSAFVDCASGTENTLTDASNYTNIIDGEDQKACLFSEGQLLFSGNGKLIVNGNYKHGICSDDYVFIHSGTKIDVASAASDAIHANDKIVIAGGILVMTPSSDGLDCEEGNIDIRGGLVKANITGAASKAIKAETDISISGGQLLLLTSGNAEYDSDDRDISSSSCIKSNGNTTINNAVVYMKSTGTAGKGINSDGSLTISNSEVRVVTTGNQYVYGNQDSSAKGIRAEGDLTINSGTVWIRATGGDGSEGLSGKTSITINDGTVCIFSYDDCIGASNSIVVNGGNIYCYSSANDGMDSNGTLTINGGTIVCSGTTTPEGGFDCDQNTFKITGGTLIGVGGDSSTPTSSSCTQRSVIYNGSGSSGLLLTIVSSDGSQVMSYTIPRNYSQMELLFSSPLLDSGTTYTIYTGGSVSGGTSFYGLTTGGTFTAGTSVSTFTPSSMVTSIGSSSMGGTTPGGKGR